MILFEQCSNKFWRSNLVVIQTANCYDKIKFSNRLESTLSILNINMTTVSISVQFGSYLNWSYIKHVSNQRKIMVDQKSCWSNKDDSPKNTANNFIVRCKYGFVAVFLFLIWEPWQTFFPLTPKTLFKFLIRGARFSLEVSNTDGKTREAIFCDLW